jgi:hypothetical protein
MERACSTHGRYEKCVKILVGKPEGKRPFGRPRCRWKDNIRTDLREMEWRRPTCIWKESIRMDLRETESEVVDWMHLAQDGDQWQALAITVMNFGFHKRRDFPD